MADLDSYQAPADLDRFRTVALGAGGIALIAWAIGAYFAPEQGLRSWLLAFIYWGGMTFGSLGILMLQYLTGGAWGLVLRRVLEAGTRTFPVVAIAFLPLLFGVSLAYEFTHLPADDYTVAHRGWFMTAESWILRSVIYFALLGVMVYLLNKWGANQDKSADYEEGARWMGRAAAFSGPTMVFFVIIVTFATVDWVMILDPHWFSTMWGLLFVIGWALATLCLSVVVLAYLFDRAPMNRVLGKRHFHDLGKLMLAFVMVWAYFNLSQFLIIWSGNIPEETGWYLSRMSGGWGWVGAILIIFHFAIPFLVLLQQDFKRRAKQLAAVALFILVMRWVDLLYLISPNPRIATHGKSLPLFESFSWMDIVAPVALGGIWLWFFLGQLAKRPLVPVMDPFLQKAIDHGKGH
jgi:hypothetical protein